MRTSAAELRKLLPPIFDQGAFRPTWASMTEGYCSETGLTRNEVFSRLFAAGLRVTDFSHLEELSHPRILARMDPYGRTKQPVSRSRKSDVVAYLRSWATGIEEFHDPRQSQSTHCPATATSA
jgi:hypothetical protein